MNSAYLIGFGLIFVAGVTQGTYVLPMKYTRAWKWEHLWFWFSVIAFFVLPLLVALATLPRLTHVYPLVPSRQLILVALFGMGWGLGSVFFGLGVDALGMALGFSMITGLYTALGALIPLVVLTPELAFRRAGLVIMAGNVVMLAGVILCAVAGDRRDKSRGNNSVLA